MGSVDSSPRPWGGNPTPSRPPFPSPVTPPESCPMSRPATKTTPAPVVVEYPPLADARLRLASLGSQGALLALERRDVESALAVASRAVPDAVEARAAALLGRPIEQDLESPARVRTLEARLATLSIEAEAIGQARRTLEAELPALARQATAALSEQLAPEVAKRAGKFLRALRAAREAFEDLAGLTVAVESLRPTPDAPVWLQDAPMPGRQFADDLKSETMRFREQCQAAGIDVPADPAFDVAEAPAAEVAAS